MWDLPASWILQCMGSIHQLAHAQLPEVLAAAAAVLGPSAQTAQKAAELLLPAPSVAHSSEVAALHRWQECSTAGVENGQDTPLI